MNELTSTKSTIQELDAKLHDSDIYLSQTKRDLEASKFEVRRLQAHSHDLCTEFNLSKEKADMLIINLRQSLEGKKDNIHSLQNKVSLLLVEKCWKKYLLKEMIVF